MSHWTEKLEALEALEALDACDEAVEWARTQSDLATAWAKCERADWMLWLAAKLLPRPIVVQAACDCAETSLHLITEGGRQMAAILALHVAREWAEDREDVGTVRAAADDAADAAAYASAAACFAADADDDAYAYAAYAAGYAADEAANAANAANAVAAAARKEALKSMADLVRVRIPNIAFKEEV